MVTEIGGTLLTIAKDVKIQVEFNPARVQAYRLIGYENRMLRTEDFNDDTKDAGELGAGHSVTALYEVIPTGVDSEFLASIDSLRYQTQAMPSAASDSQDLLFVKLRYKLPDADESQLIQQAVLDASAGLPSIDLRFASAVAGFGMLLRDSEYSGELSLGDVLALARGSIGEDSEGYRAEFVRMVESVNSGEMLAVRTTQ